MRDEIKRSPLFYVGDKYKLMEEIRGHFPTSIGRLIEPFVGGGSVFMNTRATSYLLNDIDPYVIELHRMLTSYRGRRRELYNELERIIRLYGLSYTYVEDVIPNELKEQHPKTYIARYNKDAYLRMRSDYNRSQERDPIHLYLLLIYGFNRMLRFNSRGDFNIPVGNVDFNSNTRKALDDYLDKVERSEIAWYALDYRAFFKEIEPQSDDLIYLDPPYLITHSEYNKLWGETEERELYLLLDDLCDKGIQWALSNVAIYKGVENTTLTEWASKYRSTSIKSNYISYHDNTIKKFDEVLITNY